MSYLQGHSNLSVWKARKWVYQINPGKQIKDIHLRIDYNFFLCDFCRSGSRTRTRCPFYWAHLKRRLSSSSRNATGVVIRTYAFTQMKKNRHTHTYTVHIYIHAHCTGSKMGQLVHCTQVEHRNIMQTSGKFLMLGCLQTIDSQSNLYWWLTKQEDSQYIVPTYSCVTIILQVLSQTFKYGFSLSHF